MPAAWSTEEKFRLLLVIFNEAKVKLPPWTNVAEQMGQGYTHQGCRQQYQKIRRTVNDNGDNVNNSIASTSTTPQKRKQFQTVPRDDSEIPDPITPKKPKWKKEEDVDWDSVPRRAIIKSEKVEDGVVNLMDDDEDGLYA